MLAHEPTEAMLASASSARQCLTPPLGPRGLKHSNTMFEKRHNHPHKEINVYIVWQYHEGGSFLHRRQIKTLSTVGIVCISEGL